MKHPKAEVWQLVLAKMLCYIEAMLIVQRRTVTLRPRLSSLQFWWVGCLAFAVFVAAVVFGPLLFSGPSAHNEPPTHLPGRS